MSLCTEGLNTKVKGGKIPMFVEDSHPLIQLANLINWSFLAELAQPDLKRTRKGFWWLGRKLRLRIHLAVMILQMLYKWSDRLTEVRIRITPLYQLFCGLNCLSRWKCPDHTKIEEFRNRLSPETHKKIADYIIKLAIQSGFADPSELDVDSTVQEANMSYPSDANLMNKLVTKAHGLLEYLKGRKEAGAQGLEIKIKEIRKRFQSYIFAKNIATEKKYQMLREYHSLVKSELRAFVGYMSGLPSSFIEGLPWNHRGTAKLMIENTWRYLLDVGHFLRTGTLKKGKILSLGLRDVACFKKGKIGKEKEFGRAFQLGRIKGNFLIPYLCTSVRMPDKRCLPQIILEHMAVFDERPLQSVTTDKGYYSRSNVEFVKEMTGDGDGIQRPRNVGQAETPQKKILFNRRAGVEPLIGHAKRFGLGKSRMKSDKATLAAGYRAVTGFNLHQFLRNLSSPTQLTTAR